MQVQGESRLSSASLRYGLTALVLANVALSFGPWFVRLTDVGPVASAFWRMALALPLLFAIAARGATRLSIAPRTLGWLLLAGLFFAVDLASWHLGIFETKLANANLLGNSASLFFPIAGFLLARRWPTRWQALALLLALLGGVLLMGRSYEVSPQNLRGDLLCLLAGIFYTFYLIALDRMRGGLGPWPVLAWSSLGAAPALLLAAWGLGETIWPHDWRPLIALMLFSQVIGQGLLVLVIGRLSNLVIGIAFLIQPLVAAVIGAIVYGEKFAAADGAGAILIGLALILVRQPDRSD